MTDWAESPAPHGLLIGVGGDLPATVEDVRALARLLGDPEGGGYPPDHLTALTAAAAHREAVLSGLDRLVETSRRSPDSPLLLYYSGHGGLRADGAGRQRYFLFPSGWDRSAGVDRLVSGEELTERIEAIRSRRLLVLLDCCHAGGIPHLKSPVRKAPAPQGLLDLAAARPGLVVVGSCRAEEVSYVGKDLSVFTACLLEALGGASDERGEGVARLLPVLAYLFDRVPRQAPGPQHPFVAAIKNLEENFVLCRCPRSARPAPAPPPSPLRRQQLLTRREILTGEHSLRAEKLRRLRLALATENDVLASFKLEHQVLQEETRIDGLNTELREIESLLGEA